MDEITFCNCKDGCNNSNCQCFDSDEYCADDCSCANCKNLRVTPEDRALVDQCINTYYNRLIAYYADAPEEIKAELMKELKDQRSQPYNLTEYDVTQIEEDLPADLPPVLIAYLTCKNRIQLEWHGCLLSEDPDEILAYLSTEYYWNAGYLLFGSCQSNPLLLDIEQPTDDGDYAVVALNHDDLPDELLEQRESLLPYIVPVARSFKDLLIAICEDRPLQP